VKIRVSSSSKRPLPALWSSITVTKRLSVCSNKYWYGLFEIQDGEEKVYGASFIHVVKTQKCWGLSLPVSRSSTLLNIISKELRKFFRSRVVPSWSKRSSKSYRRLIRLGRRRVILQHDSPPFIAVSFCSI